MILLDTSGLWAAIDSSQRSHLEVRQALATAGSPRILSPFILAELDYLLSTRVGQHAALSLLREVSRGAYFLAPFSATDVAAAAAVVEQYSGLHIGLADASIVVLAREYGCTTVLTLDDRHFRAVTGPHDTPFRLLPSDEEQGRLR